MPGAYGSVNMCVISCSHSHYTSVIRQYVTTNRMNTSWPTAEGALSIRFLLSNIDTRISGHPHFVGPWLSACSILRPCIPEIHSDTGAEHTDIVV